MKTKSRLFTQFTSALFLHWATVFAIIVFGASFDASAKEPKAATDISGTDLRTMKSESVSLIQNNTITVIFFVSAKCPCSMSHQPIMTKLAQQFGQSDKQNTSAHKIKFQFIAIHSNADEPEAMAHEHFKLANFPFPVIQDNKCFYADQWGAFKTPHAFVLHWNGKILYQGGVDDSHSAAEAKRKYLADALKQIADSGADANAVTPAETRCLGCVIKRP